MLAFAMPADARSPHSVGALTLTAPTADFPLRDGLVDLGHEIGRTVILERRFASGDNARFPELAREILKGNPTVIFSPCGFALRAIREINRTVPVVAVCADHKNFLGEVASLRRPGGATTGATFLAPESASKRLEILKEIRPELKRVAFLYHTGEDWETYWAEIARVTPALGLSVIRLPIKQAEDVDSAFATALKQGAESLVLFPDATTVGAAKRIADLALKHRLMSAADFTAFAEGGGLVSFGVDYRDLIRRVSARQVDMILRGAKPAEMPVEQPTNLHLVVNLKTAKALGLMIPRSVLLRADRVID
jgi:putative tryptophan/tyrosine transport system substrate-binding protein